jgi:putative flippase GtrA
MLEKLLSLFRAHIQIIKYIISGGTAAVVDILFLFLFTDIFGWWYIISSICAFLVAFCVSFFLQKFWTFKDNSTKKMHVQVSMYLIVSVGNLLWNTLLMYLFVDIAHLWYILAQVLAGGIVAVTSFFIYKKFIFKTAPVIVS